jgi:hypothetical protein
LCIEWWRVRRSLIRVARLSASLAYQIRYRKPWTVRRLVSNIDCSQLGPSIGLLLHSVIIINIIQIASFDGFEIPNNYVDVTASDNVPLSSM